MELWVGAVNLGLIYALVATGIFITFRIHNFPDITVDGSFTLGAAVSAVLIYSGVDPFTSLAAAFAAGSLAGVCTAEIHNRLNVNGLLAGILVMSGLYSINLHLMGRANIPLLDRTTFITYIQAINPGMPEEAFTLLALIPAMIFFWLAWSVFFKTDFGISMRVTGNNPVMASAAGVNPDRMKTFGIALANGLTAVAGGLVAQYQGFADVGMGIGTIIIGLAAVIIGESVFRGRSIYLKVLGVILGSVIFRLIIACALAAGMNPIDLKLLTSLFVLGTLAASKVFAGASTEKRRALASLARTRIGIGLSAAAVLLLTVYALMPVRNAGENKPMPIIGVVQVSDSSLLTITREGLEHQLHVLGYRDGVNCRFLMRNANGDMATLNTIMDEFLRAQVDLVVTISTQATQTAIGRIKNRPIVFATVANPFIIGAGNSDTDHLPNVTGVYGWAEMDKMMEIVTGILTRDISIGCLWDSSQSNSIFNVEQLKEALVLYPEVKFVGATVAGSSEVYQTAQSLAQKGIDAFVLPPDNVIYSAFDSVVKAARSAKIPIFLCDVERLDDGALAARGYDYFASGTQAAFLVHRVLNGEAPANLPFERYKKSTFGLNRGVAEELEIAIPPAIAAQADMVTGEDGPVPGTGRPVGAEAGK